MANLHLFGTVFPTGANNTILRPATLPGNVSGTFANGVASIRITSPLDGSHSVALELNIRMAAAAGTDFRPAAGVHPQPGNALFRVLASGTPVAQPFQIRAGAIEITNALGAVETIDGEVSLRVPRAILVATTGLPLILHSGEGGGVALNLSAQPRLTLRPHSLRVTAAGVLDVVDPINMITLPTPMLDSVHESQEIVFPLANGGNAPRLLFEHTSVEPLYLHADLRDRTQPLARGNELFAPLGVTGHALDLELGRDASGAFLEKISVAPANGAPLTLHAFAYAGRRNEHAQFDVSDPLALHARVGTEARPATLLIAAFDGAPPVVANKSGDVLHGMVAAHEFRPATQGVLLCRRADELPGNAAGVAIAPAIVREHTTPWLRFGSSGGMSMRHAKAGQAFVEGTRISHLDFSGGDVLLPLLPKECFQSAPQIQDAHYVFLGTTYATHTHQLRQAQHETLLSEAPSGPPEVRVAEMLSRELLVDLADVPSRREADIRLQKHQVVLDYGRIQLTIELPDGQSPDYVIVRDAAQFTGFNTIELDGKSGGKFSTKPQSPVLAIAKISRRFTLAEILARESIGSAEIGDLLPESVDETVRSAGWTGLLLFRTTLDFSEMGVLAGLLPPDALTLEYVALSPVKDGRVSINARVQWVNENTSAAPARVNDNEATFRMTRLDSAWNDSELVYFHAEAEAKFDSFFGVDFNQPGDTKPLPDLQIVGSYEPKTGTIRFLGKLSEPLELLPADFGGLGPIRQVRIRGAEIISSSQGGERETAISIDGGIDLRPFGYEGTTWFDLGELPSIDFAGLQIVLPRPDLSPIWGRIRYPSLELRTKSSPFRFGFLELKLQRIAVDWNALRPRFDWGSLIDLKRADHGQWLRTFRFDLRLELMKLPELAAKAIDRLILDFTIGFGLRDGQFRFSEIDMHIGLGAVGFDRLRLDLMRFLELSCESVKFSNVNGVKRLSFTDVVLRVVGKKFVDGLSFVLFSSEQGEGFLGFLPFDSEDANVEGALAVYWLLAGHNVSLRSAALPGDQLARKLLSIDSPTVQGDNVAIRQAINEAVRDETFLSFDSSMHGGGWLFASGFDFFGLFQGKFLFQDGLYYGGVLRGGVFEEWFGRGFAISVLYTRGPRPELDTLYAALRVPMVVTGTFTFMGGVIALEIVMNGGFTLDVGFPWLQPSGARLWDHALGAIVTPFQGSGGFYVRKYNQASVVKNQNGEGLLLGGGYAVQFGLGASFGGGAFRVWATIGVYAITEGQVYFEKIQGKSQLRGLALIGAVGIVGRAGGELNWWIISARVEIMISAETRLTLQWGRFLPDPADPAGGPIHVTTEFIVYARASAEACIGSGWFRVCKSISVELPMRFAYRFQIGG